MDDKEELGILLLQKISANKGGITVDGRNEYRYKLAGYKYSVLLSDSVMKNAVDLTVDVIEQLLLLRNNGLEADKFNEIWQEAILLATKSSEEFDPHKAYGVLKKYINESLEKLIDSVPDVMVLSTVWYSFFQRQIIVVTMFKIYHELVNNFGDKYEVFMGAYLLLCMILTSKASKVE